MVRKAHVKRIYQTDDQGNVADKDVWLDILRIDQWAFQYRGQPSGATAQDTLYVQQWKDEAQDDTGQENPVRKTDERKVYNPDDKSQFVQVWIVDKLKIDHRDDDPSKKGGPATHVVRAYTFDNVPKDGDPGDQTMDPSQVREVSPIRVVNNDLGGDPSQGGLDMTQGPVNWDDYQTALQSGKQDSSQKVDVECCKSFKLRIGADVLTGDRGQDMTYVLTNNKTVAALFQQSPDDATLVRLDPLQTIVNVAWSTGLAVEFYPKDT
jgi:hypothetical protein